MGRKANPKPLESGPSEDAEIIRSGWLLVEIISTGCFGGVSWKKKYFVIKGTWLSMYNKQPTFTRGSAKPISQINLTADFGFDLEMQAYGMPIGPGKRQVVLVGPKSSQRYICESMNDAREWVQCLKWARDEPTRTKTQDKMFDIKLTRLKAGEPLGLHISRGFNASLPSEKSVILVKHIDPGSLAAKSEMIAIGDIITHINGDAMVGMTLESAQDSLNTGVSVLLYIVRKGRNRRASKAPPLSPFRESEESKLPLSEFDRQGSYNGGFDRLNSSGGFDRQGSSSSLVSVTSTPDSPTSDAKYLDPPGTPEEGGLIEFPGKKRKQVKKEGDAFATADTEANKGNVKEAPAEVIEMASFSSPKKPVETVAKEEPALDPVAEAARQARLAKLGSNRTAKKKRTS